MFRLSVKLTVLWYLEVWTTEKLEQMGGSVSVRNLECYNLCCFRLTCLLTALLSSARWDMSPFLFLVAFCQICSHYDDKNYHIHHFLLFTCLFISAAISDNSFQALLSDILILFLLFFIGIILLKILLTFVSSISW